MKITSRLLLVSMFFSLVLTGLIPVSAGAAAVDTASALPFSADPAVSAQQRAVYAVVHRYESLLNAKDTAGIMKLYAPESVAEWNDKPTFVTPRQKSDAYDALFKIASFSTVFGYASIDVYGETAVVRTYHHKGAKVVEGGKDVIDLNREVFVLRKMDGDWKITLYIFNTNPVQGEG